MVIHVCIFYTHAGNTSTNKSNDNDEDSGSDLEVGSFDLAGPVAGKRAKEVPATMYLGMHIYLYIYMCI